MEVMSIKIFIDYLFQNEKCLVITCKTLIWLISYYVNRRHLGPSLANSTFKYSDSVLCGKSLPSWLQL